MIGETGSLFWVARPVLSPDGGWIGAVGLETTSLREAVFGPRFTATLTELETGTTFELATAIFVNSRDAVAWSPDGRYAFYVTGNRLNAFDTVDRVPIEFDLRGIDDTYSVIGAA